MVIACLLAVTNSANAAVQDDPFCADDYSYRFFQEHHCKSETVVSSTLDSSDLINYLYKGGSALHCS